MSRKIASWIPTIVQKSLTDQIVFPDPVVGEVKFVRELNDFSRQGVGIHHCAASVTHFVENKIFFTKFGKIEAEDSEMENKNGRALYVEIFFWSFSIFFLSQSHITR